MTEDMENVLNEIRDSIKSKRSLLDSYKSAWEEASKDDPDTFRRTTAKTFLRMFEGYNNLYKNLEALYIINSGLKEQVELLRDILVQIPVIKSNPQIMADIEQNFGRYNEKYDSISKDFLDLDSNKDQT